MSGRWWLVWLQRLLFGILIFLVLLSCQVRRVRIDKEMADFRKYQEKDSSHGTMASSSKTSSGPLSVVSSLTKVSMSATLPDDSYVFPQFPTYVLLFSY